jgi:gamma-glutamylcyclotransferase (GGCT)/AIG2-like uncharacterized protein YtfP
MSDYLFLYGTLLSKEGDREISRVLKRLKRVGSATIQGRLYDFGEYPGAKLSQSPKNFIKGEVFELPSNNSVLKSLDEYEEFYEADKKNSLFVRAKTIANLTDGRRLKSWVYVYNRSPGRAPLILSGDYSQSKAA